MRVADYGNRWAGGHNPLGVPDYGGWRVGPK